MALPSNYILDVRTDVYDAGMWQVTRVKTVAGWRDATSEEQNCLTIASPFSGYDKLQNGRYTASGQYEAYNLTGDVNTYGHDFSRQAATRKQLYPAICTYLNRYFANPVPVTFADFYQGGAYYFHHALLPYTIHDAYEGIDTTGWKITPARFEVIDFDNPLINHSFDTVETAVAYVNTLRSADAVYFTPAVALPAKQATLNAALAAFATDAETALTTLPTSHPAHILAYILSAIRAELTYQARG